MYGSATSYDATKMIKTYLLSIDWLKVKGLKFFKNIEGGGVCSPPLAPSKLRLWVAFLECVGRTLNDIFFWSPTPLRTSIIKQIFFA